MEQFARQLLDALLSTRPRHLGGQARWTVAILRWVGSRLLSWAVLSLMLGFAAAAALVALLVLALALGLLELCLLSLLLPGVWRLLLPADVGLWCDAGLWKDRGNRGKGVGGWGHLPLCWPLRGVVLLLCIPCPFLCSRGPYRWPWCP